MKIKLDFVTNSSSCCFLLSSQIKLSEKDFIQQNVVPSSINSFVCLSTIEQLIAYAETGNIGHSCDWIMKARGPKNFWGMSQAWYDKSKNMIDGDFSALYIEIERGFDTVDPFEEAVQTLNCNIVDRFWD